MVIVFLGSFLVLYAVFVACFSLLSSSSLSASLCAVFVACFNLSSSSSLTASLYARGCFGYCWGGDGSVEKPGVILTRVRVPGRQWIFLPESTYSADSLTVPVQTSCAIVCINISAHAKFPNTGSHTIVWTHENTAHAH